MTNDHDSRALFHWVFSDLHCTTFQAEKQFSNINTRPRQHLFCLPNSFLPLDSDSFIQPRLSPTDVETPLFHAPKHDTGIIHIIRMSHSKILIDFPTSTWPQSSIKTVTGASFFNPEQTCQNEEKNLRTKPDMPSLCYEFTFKFSPAEQRPERGKVTTFLHYISPCSSSVSSWQLQLWRSILWLGCCAEQGKPATCILGTFPG